MFLRLFFLFRFSLWYEDIDVMFKEFVIVYFSFVEKLYVFLFVNGLRFMLGLYGLFGFFGCIMFKLSDERFIGLMLFFNLLGIKMSGGLFRFE